MIDEQIVDKLREVEIPDDPIERGYSNACKDKNFVNNVLNNENDPTVKAYKDFADEIDDNIDDPTIDSNESNEESFVKRRIDFSITRENGKIINSSETIPLNSILVNIIGATIGNCSKNGDEFKFNLNIEEDGSINLKIHAPNNKLNNNIISKIFNIVSDENNMDSKILNFVYDIASKISSVNNGSNSGNKYSNNPWSPWSSKIN